MKRSELEHIIRACPNIADDDEIIVIGSQSILDRYQDAPAELTHLERGRRVSERWDLIDGSIGDLWSPPRVNEFAPPLRPTSSPRSGSGPRTV